MKASMAAALEGTVTGTGGRGSSILGEAVAHSWVRVLGVCDAFKDRREGHAAALVQRARQRHSVGHLLGAERVRRRIEQIRFGLRRAVASL